jgi:cellulose synthase operon protein C
MKISRHLHVFLALLLAASILLPSCSRDPAARRQKAMELGDREFNQGKYPEASIYYGQALQIDKYYSEGHYKLAQCHIKLGTWASAFRELSRAVELQPANWPAQVQLAELSLRGGKPQDAKDRALLVLHSNPQNSDAQIVLSSADAALGDSQAALQEGIEATRMSPSRMEAFTHLGLLYVRSGDVGKAEENLKKAKALDLSGIAATMTLGEFYEQNRRWTDATNEFQAAITREPTNPVPRAALATVYMNQGQDALAEKTLADTKALLKDDPAAYRMLGDYYLGRGNNEKAIAEFSELARQHPKDPQVRKTYIQLLLLNNRVDEAASLSEDLLKKAPQDIEALVLKGEIELRRGNVDGSIQTLQNVLRAAPENAFAHYQMGLALQQKGKTQEAQTELREAVRYSPSLYEAWRALGENAVQRADWEGLHNIAVELKKTAPRSPEGYLFDATARMNQNDDASAEGDLSRLITIAPDRALGYVKLGQLRVIQKKLDEAEKLFRQGMSHEPDSFEALEGLMDVAFQKNKPVDGLHMVQTAIDKYPNNSKLYLLQAQALVKNKQQHEAEQALERATQLDSQNVNAIVLLAELQAERGARDQAIASYQRAIGLSPNALSVQVALGGLYESSGNWQTAQALYQKVLAAQPDNPVAANNLAYILLEHGGNANVALSLAQVARRGLPTSPNTADTLGWAYYQNGAYSVAQPLLEEAVKKTSDNTAYRYHLGVTYQKLKDNERARAEFEKVIASKPDAPVAEEARRALRQLPGS